MITGIILAAGQSKRYDSKNKHGKCFTRINERLLINYPVCTLKNIGISPIIIGVNAKSESIAKSVFRGLKNVEIRISSSKGTAGCLRDVLSPEITRGIVLYGDTVYLDSIAEFGKTLSMIKRGWAVIGVQQTNNLQKYMAIVQTGKGYDPIIKPHYLKKGLAYIGLFGFNDPLILNKISNLISSKRNELELTDLIKKYAELNRLRLGFYRSKFIDCNTKERISELKDLLK